MKTTLISILVVSNICWADKLQLCDTALHSCEALAREQDKYVIQLKTDETQLAGKLAEEEDKVSPWLWLFIGFVAGGAAYTGMRALTK
jgi:hypothetical protein